jgi:nitroreductase
MSEIGLFEAIDTLRSLRHLKPDPVPEAALRRILEAAIKAPSGMNAQPWNFVVVRDPDLRRRIGEVYRRSFLEVYGEGQPATRNLTSADQRVRASATYLADHMGEAPVLLFVCLRHAYDQPPERRAYSSVFPAVQNILLAARGLGLGATLTSLHKRHEGEVKALLGAPDHVETVAMIPIGYPARGRFGAPPRRPVEEVTYADRWGQRLW